MPQLQNIAVADRESIPVTHTFVPRDIIDGVGTVVETSGTPIGENTLSVSLRKTPQGRYKATLKGKFPVVQNQTINGVISPVVVRTSYAEVIFNFDATSSEQERKNIVGMIYGSLASSVVLTNDVCTKLQGVY
ncbi:coat protein [ssRNA phage SRR6255733_1]|uniref:Coat protein n=1 Tax=ssRNA phage SRR6255733_1 TaxID=2786497 RepID=A0A8S5L004_9VIRU|nr:coat protein [ssRNA phage SRR6255733_1]DAD50953.1 TPA_asm: coat protein [ssRNA phage SRR6255733_1]